MPIKGWKTFLFGLLLEIFGALELSNVFDMLTEPWAGIASIAIGAIIQLLRWATDTPIFKTEPKLAVPDAGADPVVNDTAGADGV